ncbi:MAG: CinA family protein, partial [Desulfobacteraceae bacterium]|nr:CinA family protein [Desulfobacteraceae bacterium]
ADWALAVTGIAGPDGGTSEKPVGLIFIALARKDSSGKPVDIDVRQWRFAGDRRHIRLRACHAALDTLRRALLSSC